MKRFIISLLAFAMLCFSGCGDSQKESTSTSNSISSVEQSTTTTTQRDDYLFTTSSISTLTETIRPVEMNFNDNVAISALENKVAYAILCPDGTVKTKGNNEWGQLGIGDTQKHDGWQTVSGISNVKQIYGYTSLFYALTNDGAMYYWGGLTVKPTPIYSPESLDSLYHNQILDFVKSNNNTIYKIVVSSNGSKYRADVPVLKKLSYPSGAIPTYEGYILNGKAYEINEDTGEVTYISVANNIADQSYDIHYYLTTEGSVIGIWSWAKNQKEEDFGGLGIQKIMGNDYDSRHDKGTRITLFKSGDLIGCGNNKDGQLGDGTNYSSESSINIMSGIKNFLYLDEEKNNAVFAITKDNTVYAWGKGFSSTPTPIITSADFYN